ncbi:MAG: PASTA domain-containing protein, partial [Oscillospiraceae bacterium]|nr:PASTA domain-containing protein [Oscillospiraceae bacterium]
MKTTDKEPTTGMNKRLVWGILTPMLLLAGGVITKLGLLTIKDHKLYAEMANSTHFTNKTITAGRGAIYDSAGNPLAWSATVYKVYIDPVTFREEMDAIDEKMKARQEILDQGGELKEGTILISREDLEAEIVEKLTSTLKISEDIVLTAMEKNSRYYVLQTQVEKDVADDLMDYLAGYGIESITTQQDSKRYYPQNELAAQVVGFCNGDNDGQYGLEAYYNDYLAGVDGRITSAKDAQGKTMPYRYSTTYPAQDGDDLYLTLDSTLQYSVEKNLEKMCQEFEVRNRACGIIMNAKTGAIYAMATYPAFDLNNPSVIYDEATNAALQALPEDEYEDAYVAAREKQWKNKAISELYVPGSVFKIFTAAAAIEEQAVDVDTYGYYCSGAYTITSTDIIHCHKLSGHGTLSFQGALTQSCNPAFIDIGKRLGIHKFCTYFSAFGLTEKTGIDLPGETSSIYREEEDMRFIDLATSSFGQSNALTPIEMITGIAASINGGYLVQPHVVDKIVSSDGNIVKTLGTNVRRQVVSEETSAKMRELLMGVVEDNSGSNAHIDGYKIGGKSGTGQSIVNGRVSEDKYVASYTCFAPADNPEIIMLVMADEPNPDINYYGSYVAAPCARNIMQDTLDHLGYYPEYTEEQYQNLDISIPLLINSTVEQAKATLDDYGLEYKILGEGTSVTGQCPTTGSMISPDGT